MVCLGFEPGAAGWKAQTNPLSYGGTPIRFIFLPKDFGRAIKQNRRGETILLCSKEGDRMKKKMDYEQCYQIGPFLKILW